MVEYAALHDESAAFSAPVVRYREYHHNYTFAPRHRDAAYELKHRTFNRGESFELDDSFSSFFIELLTLAKLLLPESSRTCL